MFLMEINDTEAKGEAMEKNVVLISFYYFHDGNSDTLRCCRRENLFLYLRCFCDTSKIYNRNLSSTIHWPTMKLRIAFAPGILFL